MIEAKKTKIDLCINPREIYLEVVTFRSAKDNTPRVFKGTLGALLGTHQVRSEKNGPAFSPVSYASGCRRSNAGVKAINAIELDYDHRTRAEISKLKERLELLGYAYALYTTFSHRVNGEDDNCFRLIIIISRPLTPQEFPRIHIEVATSLGGQNDKSAKDPARLFYLPACPVERKHHAFVEYGDGKVFDVDAFLSKSPLEPQPLARHVKPMNSRYLENGQKNSENNSQSSQPLKTELLDSVLTNCTAINSIVNKAKSSEVSHDEGFSLLHLALRFQNGREWFRARLPSWDRTAEEQAQIDQSVRKGYAPWGCKRLQEAGICTYSNPEQCLPRRVRGDRVVEPNPIQFAFQEKKKSKLNSILKFISDIGAKK
jgi:hypothetical protein